MECGQCNVYLVVPRGARTVECPHCRRVTRVERRGAVGMVMNVFGRMGGGGARPAAPPRIREAGYPRVHGDKRALLVGIKYTDTDLPELSGPINDVKGMTFLLTQKYGFPRQSILVLTGKTTVRVLRSINFCLGLCNKCTHVHTHTFALVLLCLA